MTIDLSLPRSSNEIVKVWPSRDPRLQVAHIISVLYLLTHQQENPQDGETETYFSIWSCGQPQGYPCLQLECLLDIVLPDAGKPFCETQKLGDRIDKTPARNFMFS